MSKINFNYSASYEANKTFAYNFSLKVVIKGDHQTIQIFSWKFAWNTSLQTSNWI